jgi:membrane protease YdiL (CAAX protease family)
VLVPGYNSLIRSVPAPADSVRLFALVFVWAGTFHALNAYGVRLLPASFAHELTLETYFALVHFVTFVMGLGAARLLLRNPREALALTRPSGRAIGTVLGLLPALFVLVTSFAFLVARPTLLAELVRGGRDLVQRSTGEFGRELTESPAALALLWGAVISPISEELFFRGAMWSLVQSVVATAMAPSATSVTAAELPVELIHDSPLLRIARASGLWLRDGGVATLFMAALFGVMHQDMPGGLGIVRFISALGLGLACGLARQHAASVFAPILLHVLWNALSIAAVRRWIVTPSFPMKYGAPTLVTLVGVLGTGAVVAAWVMAASERRTARSSSSRRRAA